MKGLLSHPQTGILEINCVELASRFNVRWHANSADKRGSRWAEQGANGWIFARSHYQYDSNSREVATWRDEQGSKGERFAYNPANQLTKVYYNADSVWQTDSPPNETRKVDYTYTPDTLNRQSVNDNGAVSDYGASGMNQ